MKKIALLFVLALQLAVCGCGNSTKSTTTTTSTSGVWEANLTNGTGQNALLNFVVAFSVNNTGPLDITGFAFFNQGACFETGLNKQTESGSATLGTGSTGQVSGPFSLTVTSSTTGTSLALTGTLTGSSNGTTTTTGTLSNGVVVGSWTLSPGSNAAGCSSGTGSFVMCQGTATCSTTAAAEKSAEIL